MRTRLYEKNRSDNRKKKKVKDQHNNNLENNTDELLIYDHVDQNVDYIKNLMGNSSDLISRTFTIQYNTNYRAAVFYIDELVNKEVINNFIFRPLMIQAENIQEKKDLWNVVVDSLIQAGEIKQVTELKMAVDSILIGDTVLFIDGYAQALVIGTKGWATRSITDPRAESVVRGPREGLSETVSLSLAMIRRRLRDPMLRIKTLTVGERTNSTVDILYLDELADPTIVEEVVRRVKQIKIDGILETGYIEELIQDHTWTPFPQVQNTERPDAVVAHLLEGKVAILLDGTPHALIVPAVFTQFYSSPEDYYENYTIAIFLRFIRLFSLFIATLLPAIYIAFVTFHPEMIPSNLAIAMAAGRASVPFSPILEALVMEVSVEILREASIRIPGPIGPTIGIVGALVIGNAAVSAGLVSPTIVIVVGLTTISSYANPNYNAAISVRLIRFPLMLAASIFGLYGIMIGLMILILHLIQLRSVGVPYMAPYAPLKLTDLKDTLIRFPWKWMKRRPSTYRPKDNWRANPGEEQQGGNEPV